MKQIVHVVDLDENITGTGGHSHVLCYQWQLHQWVTGSGRRTEKVPMDDPRRGNQVR